MFRLYVGLQIFVGLTVSCQMAILKLMPEIANYTPPPTHTHIAPLLTVENILLCVKGTGVEDKWNELAFCLHVPSTVRDEFKRNYSTSTEKLSVSLKYFLQLHPYASWRSVIVALDKMREEKIADGIRSWAEPVSGIQLFT